MDYHVLEARYIGGHVVWLRFRDGTAGEIDLGPILMVRSSSLFAIRPSFGSSPSIRSSTRWSGRTVPMWLPSFYNCMAHGCSTCRAVARGR